MEPVVLELGQLVWVQVYQEYGPVRCMVVNTGIERDGWPAVEVKTLATGWVFRVDVSRVRL